MEQNQSGPGGFDRSRLQNVQSWQRSRSDRWVAGVCGGIGRALNIDPVLIRVVMAVLIISGPGVIFYIAAWVLMPDDGSERSAAQGLLGDRVRPDHPWLWPIVIGVCVFVAIAMMSSFNVGRFVPGPLIVVAVIWLIAKSKKSQRAGRRNGVSWNGPGTQWNNQYQGGEQPRPQDTTAANQEPFTGTSAYTPAQSGPLAPPAGPSSSATQRPQDRTVEPVQAVWTEDDPLGLYVDEPPAASSPTQTKTAEPPAKGVRGIKSIIIVLTGLALAIASGSGASTPTTLAIGLATLGAGMLIGGFVGRTLWLLPLGILLAFGTAVTTVFPDGPRNFADTNFVADSSTIITATSTTYDFDAGSVHLDLTKATFAKDAKIHVNGGAGEVLITLPPDVDVNGELSAQLGDVAWLDQRQSGRHAKVVVADLGPDGKPGPRTVTLDVDLKLGDIKVVRG